MVGLAGAAGDVEVLLFGPLRELAGAARLERPAAGGATVGDIWRLLAEEVPGISGCAGVRPAVNECFTSWDAAVAAGDRVAFLPPMSGG